MEKKVKTYSLVMMIERKLIYSNTHQKSTLLSNFITILTYPNKNMHNNNHVNVQNC